ncbi:MAG: MmgE/PrpD family protein [Pseudomonadota bacterium]
MNMQSEIIVDDTPIARRLAEFTTDLAHDAIPAEVRTRALHHMLDAAGIAVASTRYPFAHPVLAGLQALGDTGDVPVFGMAARLSPRDAATMNGYLCHGLDYDDTHITGVVHPTTSVLPAVLSAATMTGATGRDLVTAYIIGVEAAARIGTCAQSAFHQVGFHPTGIVGVFACVLAAGRLMGLNVKQLENAQGLAVSQASGSMEFLEDGAWNKRFHPGWAAQSALTACALAREGFIGATNPYDGRFGFFNIFGGKYTDWVDLSHATAGLGSKWELMETGIKPYPTCHLTHACIDAALALRDHVDPAKIASIEARVPYQAFPVVCDPVENKLKPKSDYDAKFSLHYLTACALIRGRLTLDELEPEVFTDRQILALAAKISHADYANSPFPAAYSGGLTVTMTDGSTHEHNEPVNRGAADRPLSNAEIVEKFRDNAALWAGPEKVAAMETAMLGLEDAARAADAMRVFSG